ncbi:uncharacterized protein LOC128956772 [Oppia nitens]|uniref:uncharacterized protein LOC128956772 n=1 Tax=Oppia nitens TaxID=1686743 RepID=UPI0023D9C8E9|nr:uncharacterized protein LOC128956772 [Oppia nitens]
MAKQQKQQFLITIALVAILCMCQQSWCQEQHVEPHHGTGSHVKRHPHKVHYTVCPDEAILKPCLCRRSIITCDEEMDFKLAAIVDAISAMANNDSTVSVKLFARLDIAFSTETDLPDNAFKEIVADGIWIMAAPNLKTIAPNAFQGTDNLTRSLDLRNCPQLDTAGLFDIINKFVQLNRLSLMNINLETIPGQAFKSLDRLIGLHIADAKLKSIGDKAFVGLPALRQLNLMDTQLSLIGKDMLAFSLNYDQKMNVLLKNNPLLNGSTFDPEALVQLGRPTLLALIAVDHNPRQFKVLAEQVFKPFLMSNAGNQLIMSSNGYLCPDKRNEWLVKDRKLNRRLFYDQPYKHTVQC